ncbi:MAG: nucleotidyltransferase [Promethearchaeia archaeon]
MDDIVEVLRLVCNYLDENDMAYVIVGGIAVMFHGVPRTTVDIDFILKLEDYEIELFASFLKSEGFDVSKKDLTDALREGTHCTVFVGDGLLRLDLQGINSQFDKVTLERRISVEFAGVKVYLGSAEDTLINKILFRGEQDLRDARGILVRNEADLDYSYIERMCKNLNIYERWIEFQEKTQ